MLIFIIYLYIVITVFSCAFDFNCSCYSASCFALTLLVGRQSEEHPACKN